MLKWRSWLFLWSIVIINQKPFAESLAFLLDRAPLSSVVIWVDIILSYLKKPNYASAITALIIVNRATFYTRFFCYFGIFIILAYEIWNIFALKSYSLCWLVFQYSWSHWFGPQDYLILYIVILYILSNPVVKLSTQSDVIVLWYTFL